MASARGMVEKPSTFNSGVSLDDVVNTIPRSSLVARGSRVYSVRHETLDIGVRQIEIAPWPGFE